MGISRECLPFVFSLKKRVEIDQFSQSLSAGIGDLHN